MKLGKKLRDAIDLASLIWCCGGGFAVSLIVLAAFNWRAALITFGVWIISLIYAVFWMITSD